MVATNHETNGVSSDNLSLWKQVAETDPAFTKHVDMRGGYTAVDPHYQLLEATKLWGPYGTSWGVCTCVWGIIPSTADVPKSSMTLDAQFFFPGGEFPVSADMPYKHGDDCRKKLLTAVRSKALSLLGFSADVFMGKFDDEQYISAVKTKFADQDELKAKMLKSIRTAKSQATLDKCRERLENLRGDGAINKAMYDEGLEAIEQQQREI